MSQLGVACRGKVWCERCYLSIEFVRLFHFTVDIDSDSVRFIVLTQSGERAIENIVSHRKIINKTQNEINITDTDLTIIFFKRKTPLSCCLLTDEIQSLCIFPSRGKFYRCETLQCDSCANTEYYEERENINNLHGVATWENETEKEETANFFLPKVQAKTARRNK